VNHRCISTCTAEEQNQGEKNQLQLKPIGVLPHSALEIGLLVLVFSKRLLFSMCLLFSIQV
jgi:hypothetical protein